MNDYAHTVNTWRTISENTKCRIDYMFVTSSYYSQTPNGQISGNDYIGFFKANENIIKGDRITWNDLILYARPPNFVYAGNTNIHHIEVMFGLQET